MSGCGLPSPAWNTLATGRPQAADISPIRCSTRASSRRGMVPSMPACRARCAPSRRRRPCVPPRSSAAPLARARPARAPWRRGRSLPGGRSAYRPRPPCRRVRRSAPPRRRADSRRAIGFHRADRDAVHQLKPRRNDAARDDRRHRPPAASIEGKPISSARASGGFGRMRTVTCVTTPSRPSDPVTSPSRS